MDNRLTIAELFAAKRQGRKIVAISCYDHGTARLISQTDVQVDRVGPAEEIAVTDGQLELAALNCVCLGESADRRSCGVCIGHADRLP